MKLNDVKIKKTFGGFKKNVYLCIMLFGCAEYPITN